MLDESEQFFSLPEVRVVEASAGSGKTYCLARRYVQLLLYPRISYGEISLRNILAITFTNKAAYAMKGRILEFLKKIALGTMSATQVKDILTPMGLSLPQVQEKAIGIVDELIEHYNFFQVQTIDSFINTLLSGCAFKIGLSAGFKIKRNYPEYLERSFDAMIDQACRDKAFDDVLGRFLYQYLFLENKTSWFPKKDMLKLLMALYSQSNTYGHDFTLLKLQPNELYARKKEILSLLRQLQTCLPQGTHKKFLDSLNEFLLRNHDGFDFDRVSEYLSYENIPVKAGGLVPKATDRLWEEIQQKLITLSEREAYGLFDAYIEVFNHINRDFHKQASKDDVLFLPELNRRASALFDEGRVSVEELYYRLANRFRHYLLDEFQDTSRLQWQNLQLMIEEALSTGGTLFYVGDKKQAIYGFRGGEVKLFDEIKNRFGAFDVRHEMLQTNYRSQKAIVDFNNQVFALENLRRFVQQLQEQKNETVALSPSDVQELESIFHGATQQVSPGHAGGHVNIEYILSADKEQSTQMIRLKLLALLKSLKTRFDYSDIAILARSNIEVQELTSWLMAEGIFVESERTLNIKENPLILEIIDVLKFLDSPIDNLSFAKFLSGEIFQRVSGLACEEIHGFLFAERLAREKNNDEYLYRAFRKYYPRVWEEIFEDFFKNVGLFPLYELSTSLFYRLKVYENFPDEHGFFMRFLELVKEKEEEFSDLNSFLEHFDHFENDELFVNIVNSSAIKILTTHKAKGLEFDVVIIPFLGMKVHGSSAGSAGEQSYIVDESQEHLKLLRIKKKYLSFSQNLREIARVQKARSFISELCNTYVALTRAGKELYAFIPSKVGSSNNILQLLIPPDYLQVKSPPHDVFLKDSFKPCSLSLKTFGQHDWLEFLKDEFADARGVFNRQKLAQGVIFHDLLSRIDNLYQRDKTQVINCALGLVKIKYPQIGDWEIYEKNLVRLLNTRVLDPFFCVAQGKIFVEKDLVSASGLARRVDRLIVRSDEIWIVDYKTSREGREEFLGQVQEYKTIVGQIHPGQKIRGFLLYLDHADFEEVV